MIDQDEYLNAQEPNKDETICFKIEPEYKALFKQACNNAFTKPSPVLYRFVRQYIERQLGQAKIESELKKRRLNNTGK